eukprot:UN02371
MFCFILFFSHLTKTKTKKQSHPPFQSLPVTTNYSFLISVYTQLLLLLFDV